MKSLGRVLDERVLEVGQDAFGMSLDESHVFARGGMQLCLCANRDPRADRVLGVGVHVGGRN